MVAYLYVAIGGALGAMLRYALSNVVASKAPELLGLGTLIVNFLGSFFIGVLYVLIFEKLYLNAQFHTALMVGLLGAFTTFSSFSLETLRYIESGQWNVAGLYILGSVLTCVLACWMGVETSRWAA